jgi:hypothetical protein
LEDDDEENEGDDVGEEGDEEDFLSGVLDVGEGGGEDDDDRGAPAPSTISTRSDSFGERGRGKYDSFDDLGGYTVGENGEQRWGKRLASSSQSGVRAIQKNQQGILTAVADPSEVANFLGEKR